MSTYFDSIARGLQLGAGLADRRRNNQWAETVRARQMDEWHQADQLNAFGEAYRALRTTAFDDQGIRRLARDMNDTEFGLLTQTLNSPQLKPMLHQLGINQVTGIARDLDGAGEDEVHVTYVGADGQTHHVRGDVDDLIGGVMAFTGSKTPDSLKDLDARRTQHATMGALGGVEYQPGLSRGAPQSNVVPRAAPGALPNVRTNSAGGLTVGDMTEDDMMQTLAAIRQVYPDTYGIVPRADGSWEARRENGERATVPPDLLQRLLVGEGTGGTPISSADFAPSGGEFVPASGVEQEPRGLWQRTTDRLNQDSAAALDQRIPHSFGPPSGGVATPEMHEGLAAAQESWQQRPKLEAPDLSQMNNQELLQMRREIPWHRRVALGSELDAELIRRRVGLGQRIGDSARHTRDAVVGGVSGLTRGLLQRGQQGSENIRAGFEGRDPKNLADERVVQRLLETEQESPRDQPGVVDPATGLPRGLRMTELAGPSAYEPPAPAPAPTPRGLSPEQRRGLDYLVTQGKLNMAQRESLETRGTLEPRREDRWFQSGGNLYEVNSGRHVQIPGAATGGEAPSAHKTAQEVKAFHAILGLDPDNYGDRAKVDQLHTFMSTYGLDWGQATATPGRVATMRRTYRTMELLEKDPGWFNRTIRGQEKLSFPSASVAFQLVTSGRVSDSAVSSGDAKAVRQAFEKFRRDYASVLEREGLSDRQRVAYTNYAAALEGLNGMTPAQVNQAVVSFGERNGWDPAAASKAVEGLQQLRMLGGAQ